MGARCSIRVLGGFTVEVDGTPIAIWRTRRAADLVKLLALATGHRLHREQLMDALWPSLEIDAAAANLRKAVHYARRALGTEDAIRAEAGMLVLDPDAEVDADAFVAAASRATDAAGAARALAAYGGEPVPADRYEQWSQDARATLLELHRRMLKLAGGWEQVLALDPTDEEAHRALMRQHLEQGRRREAIRQFEQLREVLREHIGVGPDPDTVALYEQVLAMEGAQPPTPQERAAASIANGLVAWSRRDIEEAERCAREARRLALDANLGHEIGESATLLALTAHARGRWYAIFEEDFGATLSLDPAIAFPVYDAHICFQEFYLYGPDGHAGANTFARRLLQRATDARAPAAEALARLLLGAIEQLSGHTDDAIEQLAAAAELSHETGLVSVEAIALERLAEAEASLGREQRARELLATAWPLVERSVIPTHLTVRLYGLAVRVAEDAIAALHVVRQAERALADAPRVCQPCSMVFRVRATDACARGGDLAGARLHLAAAERVAGLWPGGPWEAAVWEARAALRGAEGEPAQASALYLEAAAGYEAFERPIDAARCRAAAVALKEATAVPAK